LPWSPSKGILIFFFLRKQSVGTELSLRRKKKCVQFVDKKHTIP
jgi:hypothetical protein